ncbi:MAG: ATP-binding protein [Parvularcula sp.]
MSDTDPSAAEEATPSGVARHTTPRGVLLLLLGLGGVAFLITAYALTNFVEGLPPLVSAIFSVVTLVAMGLSVLVAANIVQVFRNTRAGVSGERLHRRLVILLSLVAVLPAIVAFGLTGALLRSFSDEYFVQRVTEANLVARRLANGYANAQSRKMGLEIIQLASDIALQSAGGLSPENAPIGFRRYLLGQSVLRDFSAVVLLDRDGKVIVDVTQRPDKIYKLPPASAFREVSAPNAVPYQFNAHDTQTLDAYYALLKLGPPDGGFLVAYKDEIPVLSSQLVRVRDFRDETNELQSRLDELTLIFTLGYALVMVLLLLGAVWIGLWVANRIVRPVRRLVVAAEAVSKGDMAARVEVRPSDDELGDLGKSFNEMTEQLEAQRADLIAAHTQSDARRRFIETVVSGVPAGVLNVAKDGRVALSNPSADEILGVPSGRLVGGQLAENSPALWNLIQESELSPGADFRGQIELSHHGKARLINVRISPDDPDNSAGYVVTLDDITELISAQRNAAWGDVARRIAHEIKNPLTPIQLSAERLKRKYRDALGDDREVFDRCTDTIIRHVGDIGHMVNEFSSFARMPEPKRESEDLGEVVRSAVFPFTVAHPDISFEYDLPDKPLVAFCDGRLVGQAVVNLVKNATEAIKEQDMGRKGRIKMSLRSEDGWAIVEVADNGRGLPKEGQARLTEPYMTTREKGTGLGLAIVKKAVEEHGGAFDLVDRGIDGGPGATARITLPKDKNQAKDPPTDETIKQEQEA